MEDVLETLEGENVGVKDLVGMLIGVVHSRVIDVNWGRGIGAENDKGFALSLEIGEIGRNEVRAPADLCMSIAFLV